MSKKVKAAFDINGVSIALEKILPTRKIRPGSVNSAPYRRILASVKKIGIIEPLIVYPVKGEPDTYMLLDGHIRLDVLKSLNVKEVFCLISTDDEGYTYNHKVNRVSPIYEHFMVMKAIENGVSEQEIASTLDIDVSKVRQKKKMIEGICKEAVDLLKNKDISPVALKVLQKVQPMRQIEMAELMVGTGSYTISYAQALYAATPKDQLVKTDKPKEANGLSVEDITKMEKEMEKVGRDFKQIEESHGQDVLNLVLAQGYLKKLLGNGNVVRYLSKNYLDIFEELQKIVELKTLEESG